MLESCLVSLQVMATCEECQAQDASPCERCRREFCAMHIPDGDLCVGCFKGWTKLSSKGGVVLPLLTLAVTFPLFVVLNPMIAFGVMMGFVAIGVSVTKSLVPGRRVKYIEAGRPQLPEAKIAP